MRRRIFVAFVTIWCAEAQQDIKITYLTTQASVQDIVKTMARQAGLGYNWQKSFDQTDPQCRKFVRDVRIDAVPFGTAMQQILDPVGLRYQVENEEVVLYRVPDFLAPGETTGTELSKAPPPAPVREKKITYSSGEKSVQYIVIDLAKQVGLGYNWNKSFAQTDPQCREFVEHVSIKNQAFDKAMAKILNPVGLRYRLESNQVVLYRR
jgi:ABC-type proline/glycine betaine transport system substrate-binding protein